MCHELGHSDARRSRASHRRTRCRQRAPPVRPLGADRGSSRRSNLRRVLRGWRTRRSDRRQPEPGGVVRIVGMSLRPSAAPCAAICRLTRKPRRGQHRPRAERCCEKDARPCPPLLFPIIIDIAATSPMLTFKGRSRRNPSRCCPRLPWLPPRARSGSGCLWPAPPRSAAASGLLELLGLDGKRCFWRLRPLQDDFLARQHHSAGAPRDLPEAVCRANASPRAAFRFEQGLNSPPDPLPSTGVPEGMQATLNTSPPGFPVGVLDSFLPPRTPRCSGV